MYIYILIAHLKFKHNAEQKFANLAKNYIFAECECKIKYV